MQIGEGYIVRGAGTGFNGGNVTPRLNFVPNNGVKTVDIIKGNSI
jgi:hypothetical protein